MIQVLRGWRVRFHPVAGEFEVQSRLLSSNTIMGGCWDFVARGASVSQGLHEPVVEGPWEVRGTWRAQVRAS